MKFLQLGLAPRLRAVGGGLLFIAAFTTLLSCNPEETTQIHQVEFIAIDSSGETPSTSPTPVQANPLFIHLSVEQGLSQSTVFSIAQDHDGYMWFGTEDGLNRYDGYEFRIYRNEPDNPGSISHHWINSIVVDHAGLIWIGTDGGGLNRYEKETDSFIRYKNDPQDPNSLINNQVTAICEDTDGNLWLGTRGGLCRFDPSGAAFQNYRNQEGIDNGFAANEILALYEDSAGALWIGTDGAGLARFDRTSETFTNYSFDNAGDVARSAIRSIFEDRQGILWIGTQGGLTTLDRESGQFAGLNGAMDFPRSLSSANIYSITEDRDGVLWASSWGDGAYVINHRAGEHHNYRRAASDNRSLSSNVLASWYQDREGTIWIGTVADGVNKLTLDNRTFTYFRNDPSEANSLSDNWVRSIYEDRSGILWISTGDGGLNRYDRETNSWRAYTHDPEDPKTIGAKFLSGVSGDSEGNIWIATENGVNRFDPATETFTHYRDTPDDTADLVDVNRIRQLFEDRNGQLWVAIAGYGIAKLDPRTGIFTRFRHEPDNPNSLVHDKVWHIDEDRHGSLWISTSGGLSRFNPLTETFTQFRADPQDPRSLLNHYVGSVTEDPSGTLWVASYGGGLTRFDWETESFEYWTEADGLPNNVVYNVAFDDGGLMWLSTNNGLSRFDPASETFTNFQLKDGLPIVEFNANAMGERKTGELLFGGINGFVSFLPENVGKNQYVPPVVITGFNHGDEQVHIHGDMADITIEWPHDSFEFEYAALSYSNPEYNQYAYMLEGLDEEWVRAGTSRVGRYSRLPGGSYKLRIIGSNDDGLWNESGTTLNITIVPPFWAMGWFRALIIAAGLGAAFGLYVIRVRRIKERNRKLEQVVEERAAALKREATQRLAAEDSLHRAEMENVVAEERGRLARDLHDSVTQSLYSLTLFTEATRELADSGKFEQIKHGLDRSADTALQALKEMRLLVYELRPLALREAGIVGAIRHRLDAVETRAGVKTELLIEGDAALLLPHDVEEAAFRIAQEALNNALKHAHAPAITVRIEFPADRDMLELEVSDNGVGFDIDEIDTHGGLGIRSIMERADGIGARVEIKSTPGQGTRIRITVEIT